MTMSNRILSLGFGLGAVFFALGCGVSDNATDSDSATEADSTSDSTSLTYPIVDSGQTQCYADSTAMACPVAGAAFYGQDAQYQNVQFSFVDHGDGTISDLNTGLMWQQGPSSSGFTWQEAVDYCNTLSLGGHQDWRMPTIKELFSISDFSTGWPYLNTVFFDLAVTPVSKQEQYWSTAYYVGTTVEGGSDAAFGVNHGTGHIKAYPATVGGPMGKHVRAVRGNTYGVNQFVSNGSGTVTDQATGMTWAQADSGEAMDWEQALEWVQTQNAANYLGHGDWRLPNIKELQSLVDYTRSPSATDPEKIGPAIDPLFSCTAITNEAGDPDYPYYWTSTSALFQSGGEYYYAWYVAFGRAVNGEGLDFHGAGAVRFDTKVEGGPAGEGGERYYNYVRLVRGGAVAGETDDSPSTDSGGATDSSSADTVTGSDMGPASCSEQADCEAAGACPAESAKGCSCAETPTGMACIPNCSIDDDCPQLPGLNLVCDTQQGICMPQQ